MKTLAILLLLLTLALPALAGETWGPFRARVVGVVDGDTVSVEVSIWPDLNWTGRLRLEGVDTPELRGSSACERALAERAREFTRAFLAGATVVTLEGISLDKYGGRVLGRLIRDGKDLGLALIAAGHGRAYSGGKREPWCS